MSDTKHTPGPWMESSFEVWSPLNGKRFGKVVANLRRAEAPDDEARANAHLIAAAPELLEALEAVLRFDRSESIPGEYKHDVTLAPKVRAAIAKATGTNA